MSIIFHLDSKFESFKTEVLDKRIGNTVIVTLTLPRGRWVRASVVLLGFLVRSLDEGLRTTQSPLQVPTAGPDREIPNFTGREDLFE